MSDKKYYDSERDEFENDNDHNEERPEVDENRTGGEVGKAKNSNAKKYFLACVTLIALILMLYLFFHNSHKKPVADDTSTDVGGTVDTNSKFHVQPNSPPTGGQPETPDNAASNNNTGNNGRPLIGSHASGRSNSAFSRSLGGVMVSNGGGSSRENSDGTTEQGGSGIKYDASAQRAPRLADSSDSSGDDSDKIGSAGNGNGDLYKSSPYKAGTVTKSKFDPNLLLEKGTYIPCVMRHAFNSNVDGQISCIVADDVYSSAGTVKLIEKGSRVNGSYRGGNVNAGSQQMFVIWQEIRTPNNLVVNVDSGSADELGNAGLNGYVDYHWGIKLGMAELVSIVNVTGKNLSSQLGKNLGGDNNNSSSSDESTQVATEILRQYANVRPTLYKNQGDKVGIFVARDIDFSSVYNLQAKQYAN